MASTINEWEEESPRNALTKVIRDHISDIRVLQALDKPRSARGDALENVMKDAVRRSSIVSFNGVPHVWFKKLGIYVSFDYNDFKVAIYDAMRKADIPDGCYGGIDKLVKLCWAETQSMKEDLDSTVVVMGNGVFDTMDMSLHEFSPNYKTNMRVPYDYNPDERPVGWIRFLERVLPDVELQMLLQEFLAAAYVDRRFAKIEHMLILLGTGANGKSVVFEVVSALLGDGNVSNFSVSDLISSQRREQNVAVCNGKRLNYCSEIRTSEIGPKNADAFKAIVSGESQMARSLYCEPFRASNIPLIMANANSMPRLDDASYALQRRILIIPFEVFIPEDEQDKELATELKKELSGIFNWVMAGLGRLREEKFQMTIPEKVRSEVSEYIRESNAMIRWTENERIIAQWNNNDDLKEEWVLVGVLYARYKDWCMNNGEEVKTKRDFSDSLSAMGFKRSRRGAGIGVTLYRIPKEEDLMQLNMDLAIALQKKQLAEQMRKQIEDAGLLEVEGVSDLEMYLGLPKDSIWSFKQAGILTKCGKRQSNGRILFNVKEVQLALARTGFYRLLENGSDLKRKSLSALNAMRRTFNVQMRMKGVPIRKHGNQNNYVRLDDKDCWFVPDDWEYSENAAKLVMSGPKEGVVKQ
ncbi:MAG: phage/plasmid primase, P4 family [Paludibacteraceae bacterium]|nr:phage/plasmid primase, P4 family [Paludibacteraceae bacterium]